jgi:hypothetical protein
MAIAVSVTATGTNGTSASPTITMNPGASDTLALIFIALDGSATVSSISSTGDTWTVARDDTGTAPGTAIYYTLIEGGTGSRTVTVNLSGSDNSVLGLETYTGTETSSPVDVTATGSGSGTALSVSITPNGSNTLLGAAFSQVTNGAFTPFGTGQNVVVNITQGGSQKYAGAGTSEIISSGGANAQTATSSKSDSWRATAVEIKAAAGASGDTLFTSPLSILF